MQSEEFMLRKLVFEWPSCKRCSERGVLAQSPEASARKLSGWGGLAAQDTCF